MISDFLRHLFPRVVRKSDLRLTYTFCLGGLAFTSFLVLGVSGALLLFYYHPAPERAYASVQFLEAEVFGGMWVRSVHRLASHAFLILMGFHVLRVILTGAFRRPRQMNWLIGCVLLVLGVFGAYSGYLLPMDQMAFWAAETGMDLLALLPGGSFLRSLWVPDGVGRPLSLLRFYIFHVAMIPMGVLVFSALHFYRVRRNHGVLPYL